MKLMGLIIFFISLTGMSGWAPKAELKFKPIDINCSYRVIREKLKVKDLRIEMFSDKKSPAIGYLEFSDDEMSKIKSIRGPRQIHLNAVGSVMGSTMVVYFKDTSVDQEQHPDRAKILSKLTALKELFINACSK